MTDGGSEPAPHGAERPGGRTRQFLRGRSGTQRIGALAAVVILLTAPFGGLEKADEDDAGPLTLGETVDIGPFDMTLRKVISLGDLAPAVVPRPGRRLLVLDVTVTNDSDEAESIALARDAWSGQGTGALPWDDGKPVELLLYSVEDGARLASGEPVNPGQTVRVAMVLEQAWFWDPEGLSFELHGYRLPEVDPFTLNDPAWVLDKVLRSGPVTAEVES